ncbi:MAG: 2-polyprenylphenol 6-hydroxylase [Magnetococcales bacterium]|nr:2-polyprenylphenol 6-hydroxylase [Magnetococcales bacterium]
MLGHYRTFLRLLEIINVLVKFKIEPFASQFLPYRLLTWSYGWRSATRKVRRDNDAPVRLRLALEALGPTFVKFGQALSTRMDALPEEVGMEMKKLQDDVAPFTFETVREILEAELDGPLEKFFINFNPVPVASASMAQVHRATTQGGRDVAVKVRRPNVANIIEMDIGMLTTLAEFIERNFPEWKRLRAKRVVEEFAASIRNELDFQVEAARADQFQKNFKLDPELMIPAVLWELTSSQILTMEWINGVPIDELTKNPNPNLDSKQISINLISGFFKQVFRDGFFHADQHPGNIFILETGTVALLDFGIIGRIKTQDRIWLAELLQGFISRDYAKVAQVHLDAGYVPRDTDLDEFEDACRQISEPIFGQAVKDISIGRLLAQLFKVTERFNMSVQPHLLLLQKTMLTLEGVGREINPELNMWFLAEPLIREWMMENLGPRGQIKIATKHLKRATNSSLLLPELVFNGVDKLANDRLVVNLNSDSLEKLERHINLGFRRQASAIMGAGLFLGGAVMVDSGVEPIWYWPPLLLAALFFMRSIFSRNH